MAYLTREQAIIEHRKMWNWIAEQLEMQPSDDKCNVNIYFLKVKYCEINGFTREKKGKPEHYCFCCQYAFSLYDCRECPLYWETENSIREYFCEYGMKYDNILPNVGLWSILYKADLTYKEAAEIAKQIANLPEKIYQNKENGNFHFSYNEMCIEAKELYGLNGWFDWKKYYEVKPLQNSAK